MTHEGGKDPAGLGPDPEHAGDTTGEEQQPTWRTLYAEARQIEREQRKATAAEDPEVAQRRQAALEGIAKWVGKLSDEELDTPLPPAYRAALRGLRLVRGGAAETDDPQASPPPSTEHGPSDTSPETAADPERDLGAIIDDINRTFES